nr:hypothetical protein [uncultured Carboxylicivirga sp.]
MVLEVLQPHRVIRSFFKGFILLMSAFLISCNGKSEKEQKKELLATPIEPIKSIALNSVLNENSGAIIWKDTLWMQNDSSEPVLYGVDPSNGEVIKKYTFPGLKMQDWESLAQDDETIYFGDIGNNFNYRQNLRIFLVEKEALNNGRIVIDTLFYSYEDQTDYSYNEVLETDFDCEAMIVTNDSIYLFTKQWISQNTRVYALPASKGTFVAKKIAEYPIGGLITGACHFAGENTIVLTGYSKLMMPFFILLADYNENQFFSGKVKKVAFNYPFCQIEAIAPKEGYTCYITNEKFLQVSPQVHLVDLKSYISGM